MTETEPVDLPEGAIKLPSGGWVKISDERAATGKDVRKMREALNADGDGNILNQMMTRALEVRVLDWNIPSGPACPCRCTTKALATCSPPTTSSPLRMSSKPGLSRSSSRPAPTPTRASPGPLISPRANKAAARGRCSRGRPRPAISDHDLALEEAAHYEFYAERYGWTPDVVDGQPYELLDRMAIIAAVKSEIAEERARA